LKKKCSTCKVQPRSMFRMPPF